MASSYTLLQIRTDVKLVVKPEGNDPWDDPAYDRRINAAIKELASTLEIPELETSNTSLTLSTGVVSYNCAAFIPSPIAIISVRNVTQNRDLELTTRAYADSVNLSDLGEPTFFFPYSESFEVYPPPSSTYNTNSLKVRYAPMPVELASDNALSPLPPSFDRPLMQYATFLTLMDKGEAKRAQIYLSGYLAMIRGRKHRRAMEFASQPTSISAGELR